MKKHFTLLLLIFGVAVFAQHFEDYTKITAYTVYEEFDDGPCSVRGYVEEGEAFVKKVSIVDCKEMILQLLDAKRKSGRWKSVDHFCRPGWIGGQLVPNMIVLEYNKFRDTIYMTEGLKCVFNPDKEKAYRDEKEEIRKILSKNRQLKAFVEADFATLYRTVLRNFESAKDSVDIAEVFKSDNLYNYSSEAIQRLVGDFDFKEKTISYKKLDDDSWKSTETMLCDKDYAHFEFENNRLEKVRVDSLYANDDRFINPNLSTVCRFKPGDSIKLLTARFPESAKNITIFRDYFPNEDGTYTLEVALKSKKGRVYYILEGDVISRIEVFFDY